MITLSNLKTIAQNHTYRTRRTDHLYEKNGEFYATCVHGGATGNMYIQCENLTVPPCLLRDEIAHFYGVEIPSDAVLHIMPCHPLNVISKWGETLLDENILVEGTWDVITYIRIYDDFCEIFPKK